jgi:membrane protein implicated in regulation of membrane protease activity
MASPRLLIISTGALLLTVGVVASLATGSWWLLVAAVAVHAVGSTVVIGLAWKAAGQEGDKPDPVTQARIEEESSDPPEDEPGLSMPGR